MELLTTKELSEKLRMSVATIYNLRNANEFFEPVRLSARRIMWRASDADAWLASR